MKRAEFEEAKVGLADSFLSLFDPEATDPVAHLVLRTGDGRSMSLLIGMGERGKQIDSFADAMNLTNIQITGLEE